MKNSFWLLPAVALTAGSALAPCRADASKELTRPGQIRPVATTTSQVKAFTRLLSGAGWETAIVLMNLGAAPVNFRESFLGNDGSPSAFNVILEPDNTNLTTPALHGVIGPHGTVSFTLHDDGSSVREAWSLLAFEGIQNQLGGYAILRHPAPDGSFNLEVTVPLGNMLDSSASMPFDNTAGFQTQLTVVNPASNLAAQVQLTYFDAQGQTVLLDSLLLKPGEQTTLTLPNTYPDLANQTGTIGILSSINTLSVAGFRFNPASGAISAVPIIDFR